MAQAIHGGRLREAAREFGLPEHAFMDFSSNLNIHAPEVSAAEWELWRSKISRYPEPDGNETGRRLASVYGCDAGNILPTAGAIEALYLAARLFQGRKVGIIEPAFSDYARAFEAADCAPGRVALPRRMWHAPASEWDHLIEPLDVVVLGNPNNPTGAFQSRETFSRLFEKFPDKCWIVDEAFIEFVANHEAETLLPVLERHPSLIVLRSLTKSWNIPGLRLGFLATFNAGWLSRLRAMQAPWGVNAITEAWAEAFLTPERHAETVAGLRRLKAAGPRFALRLEESGVARVHPSSCNFLLVEVGDAAAIYRELGSRGLLVRKCDSFYGMPPGRFIRLAVRTDEENSLLVRELASVCAGAVERAA